MSNTTFKGRLKLKYDTLENWTSKNPVLLKGEAAIYPDKNDPTLSYIRIGNGTSKFLDLKDLVPSLDDYLELTDSQYQSLLKRLS